jgi:hypothetical protein
MEYPGRDCPQQQPATGLLAKLRGGDRRSIGRADEVVADVLEGPELFGEIFEGMVHGDPLIRMRAADAVEKVTRQRPELLKPYQRRLLEVAEQATQQEVRWHVAPMLTRVQLNSAEARRVYAILLDYLDDTSSIVKTNTMQALADLAAGYSNFHLDVVRLLRDLAHNGTPAMRSRGRKLLANLERH